MGLVAPKNNFFDTVEEALLGSVAHDEIKNLVVSCVSMCFEHDTDGEVQICRFHELREHYERHAIVRRRMLGFFHSLRFGLPLYSSPTTSSDRLVGKSVTELWIYHCILHEWTVTFFIEEALLGSVAQDEIKNLVVSCVIGKLECILKSQVSEKDNKMKDASTKARQFLQAIEKG